MVLVIAESPKWLYTWKNFQQAREILGGVARFNAVEETELEKLANSKFVQEDEVALQETQSLVSGRGSMALSQGQ